MKVSLSWCLNFKMKFIIICNKNREVYNFHSFTEITLDLYYCAYVADLELRHEGTQ